MKKVYGSFLFLLFVTAFSACGGGGSSEKTYVAIGASDATGIGAIPPTNGYVFLIENELDARCGDTSFFNLGIPGAEADQIEDIEIPAATVLDPDIVSVFVGGNDLVSGRSVESFSADVFDILETLRAETEADIYIGLLPDLTLLPRFQEEQDENVTQARVQAFNDVILSAAAATGSIVVDLRELSGQDVLVSQDGFHPSNEGHARVADLFIAAIVPNSCP